MKSTRKKFSLLLLIMLVLGSFFNMYMKVESLPEFYQDRPINEPCIRSENKPIEESAIVKKYGTRQISYNTTNQNRITFIASLCILIIVDFLWKKQIYVLAVIWYALERYRKYISRVSVRRGPPVKNV